MEDSETHGSMFVPIVLGHILKLKMFGNNLYTQCIVFLISNNFCHF